MQAVVFDAADACFCDHRVLSVNHLISGGILKIMCDDELLSFRYKGLQVLMLSVPVDSAAIYDVTWCQLSN